MCTPRSRWSCSADMIAFGMAPMPVWIVDSFGTRSATYPAIARSMSVDVAGGTDTRGRSERHQSDDLADVELVAAERAWHVFGDLEEEPRTADEARGVVGRHAEREVAVLIRRGDAAAITSGSSVLARMIPYTSEKWAGTRPTCPVAKCGRVTCDRKYEMCFSRSPYVTAGGTDGRGCACIWCTRTPSRSSAWASIASIVAVGSPFARGTTI